MTPRRSSMPPYKIPEVLKVKLTPAEIEKVQGLIDQNVPSSTVAAVVDSMIAGHDVKI
jgi:hypothetical protein